MGRSRVRSLLLAFGSPPRNDDPGRQSRAVSSSATPSRPPSRLKTPALDAPSQLDTSPAGSSGPPKPRRLSSRPESTVFTSTPPLADIGDDTPPELQPIFSLLNSHANKLYHEGYFLKLNDLDTHGRSCPDRQWIECYAQLIGTALIVWNAAALDTAAEEDEVPPTFVNLADSSIKMIESMPMTNQNTEPLKNVLSIRSAGQNRYLLHFNSFHSLTQWTAAIRLSIFELTSLYEAYTGSIIAGKGKHLNNIQSILGRFRFKHEDWARVRFGAGTPWRRCWFVINPPDEKELQKLQKSMKKSPAQARAQQVVRGDIKFYESKRTKKSKPIATISNVYAAYAVYPQSESLIDQSTLAKIEGQITIHSQPESTSEGFVFVMPEAHPAVSGFEMLLRFLIPTFDTFSLYGRPTRLIAETTHIKSIMFAFPKRRRHGYLDTLDVLNLLQITDSHNWSEEEWRLNLKKATADRMTAVSSRASSVAGSTARFRSGFPNSRRSVRVESAQLLHSPLEIRLELDEPPDTIDSEVSKKRSQSPPSHCSPSDTAEVRQNSDTARPSEAGSPTSPSDDVLKHEENFPAAYRPNIHSNLDNAEARRESTELTRPSEADKVPSSSFAVASLPQFTRGSRSIPAVRPQLLSDMKKANRMSDATLTQLAAAGRINISFTTENGDSQQQVAFGKSIISKSDAVEDSASPKDEVVPLDKQKDIISHESLPLYDQRPPAAENTGPLSHRPNAPSGTEAPKVIKRKPTPQMQVQQLKPQARIVESDLDELSHAIDRDVPQEAKPHDPSIVPTDEDAQARVSFDSSESTAFPNNASTEGSIRSVHLAPERRMGVLKTVGSSTPPKTVIIGDACYTIEKPQGNISNVPPVDFGPTLSYFPAAGRPWTSDSGSKSFDHNRNGSSGATTKLRYPTAAAMDRTHSTSSSKDEHQRSIAWQPALIAAGHSNSPGYKLTPEQYVQQLATQQSVYVHRRTSSSVTPLPPLRPLSRGLAGHLRTNSQPMMRGEMLSRPNSREASSVLSYNAISSRLTAREQEHVARMTGSTFFNLSSSSSKHAIPANPMGLVGAIDAREREKQEMKEALSNKMVQHAIAQRQQHEQRYAQAAWEDHYSLQARNIMYNLPTANLTLDALNYPNRDDNQRLSWYGPYTSPLQTPLVYKQNQVISQQPGYFGNANTIHY